MQNKKNIFLSIGISCLCLVAAGSVIANKISFSVSADATNYSIKMANGKNEFDTSNTSSVIKTELGNDIKFTYSNLISDDNSWHILSNEGYFNNVDPIHGISNISMSFNTNSANFKIYWSNDLNFTDENSVSLTTPSSSDNKLTFDFDGYFPIYFKVENTSGEDLNISSVDVEYDCVDSYSKLTVTSSDDTMGSVSGPQGMVRVGSEINVTATPNTGYKFDGWYEGDNKVSSDNPYTFTMPDSNYNLVATFSERDVEWEKAHGVIPVVTTNNQVTYGLYPQTVVDDTNLISALTALDDSSIDTNNGWYLYNDEYYAKITANPHEDESGYKFDNGEEIKNGATYWFLCEVITWDILTSSNGEYYLLSNKLLDAHCYYTSTTNRTVDGTTVYANNYEYSDIRAWLNGYDGSGYDGENYSGKGFLNTAFALGSNYINTTTVDNSAATTNSDTNPYVCENTQDKVLLPSYKDYYSTYFSDNSERQAKTTDYARANGAYSNTATDNLNNGWYYTRSPNSGSSNFAWYVGYDGILYSLGRVNYAYSGVRPSLSLQIS